MLFPLQVESSSRKGPAQAIQVRGWKFREHWLVQTSSLICSLILGHVPKAWAPTCFGLETLHLLPPSFHWEMGKLLPWVAHVLGQLGREEAPAQSSGSVYPAVSYNHGSFSFTD